MEQAPITRYQYHPVTGARIGTPTTCHCGKTVYRDAFGCNTGNTCPRECEAERPRRIIHFNFGGVNA